MSIVLVPDVGKESWVAAIELAAGTLVELFGNSFDGRG